MLWSTSLLLLASADYALASHGRSHAHRHRAHNQAKPAVEGVETMDPWGLAWADAAPAPVAAHEEVHTVFKTLTKTIYGKCAPTNTGLTTKILDNIVPRPTLTKPEPESTNSKVTQPKPTESKPTESKPAHPIAPKPEFTKPEPEPTQPQNTMSLPVHSEMHSHLTMHAHSTTDEVTTIHIHKTKTVTATVTATASTAKVSVDVTAPKGTIIATSSSTSESVEARPKPDPTRTKQAPNVLQTLDNLPGQIPGDIDQILPGVATVVPVPGLPNLDQVLHPGSPAILDWTSIPSTFTSEGFGGQSSPSGSNIQYKGNVGKPWGSNIISVSPAAAHRYKYVVQFNGPQTQPWTVLIWNKIGPDDKIDGWYGHSALTFVIAPGETYYVAFDEDSEGAWGAAPGTHGLPTDSWGGYTSTWGEFSFGDGENNGWSGWDVSAIQAQVAGQEVQGMRICMADGKGCSVITPGAEKVVDAYTESKRHHDGIGGAASPGPVRLVVDLDYQE
ncbi:Allergen Asp f 4 [Penicillium atrosanguineum]|nr:Allergen Asp f 4 [Penicillium atrosanguineum]